MIIKDFVKAKFSMDGKNFCTTLTVHVHVDHRLSAHYRLLFSLSAPVGNMRMMFVVLF